LNHGKPNIFSFELEINLLEKTGFYKSNPKTFGEYIRKTRLDRKMTARELAELVGCSKNILLDWEKDRRVPRLMHLKRLYEVLGVPHEFLREVITKSYSLSDKERDMLFRFDLIQENLNGCMEPIYNKDKKNFLQFDSLLRILRLCLFMTHREFAKILGVYPSTVLDWQNGRNRLTKSSLNIIRRVFNFTKQALRN
jgi:transcriptional regulator with XRE-family HTH domain